MNANLRKKGSTRDYVYKTVRDQIVNWDLKPGQKISEKEVAEKLHVSRTPVREAFLQLGHEDLLDIFPQIGTVVSRIDFTLVEEARFVRENIEKAIVKDLCNGVGDDFIFDMESNLTMQSMCIQKGTNQRLFELDEEFHRLLFQENKKLRTWVFIRQMNGHFDRLRVLRLASNTNWELLVSHHKQIFDCIMNKDAEGAEKVMGNHLELVNLEKGELKARYPNYFK
ncbi:MULTISPECIES: GntR family transcriptional regulator [Bacillaceae]|uniref:GntR family transcriptional regulator n=1 Tax=Evansella alkalicola TaxID=745819 RepID=A0ABS6JSM3_9BACI|nr:MULTISPECIES: GntR family transcriptional regulator [Bacillaceae]MBU9721565.1 GntR family transcriptional regulator [Bacillus alkalicola]